MEPGTKRQAVHGGFSVGPRGVGGIHARPGPPTGGPTRGGSKGPDLAHIGSATGMTADWLAAYIKDPKSQRVRDVMTAEVIYCREDDDVAVAARMMKDRQIRRLIVIGEGNRLVGIVSLGDIATETDEEVAGNTLEAVSQPAGAIH